MNNGARKIFLSSRKSSKKKGEKVHEKSLNYSKVPLSKDTSTRSLCKNFRVDRERKETAKSLRKKSASSAERGGKKWWTKIDIATEFFISLSVPSRRLSLFWTVFRRFFFRIVREVFVEICAMSKCPPWKVAPWKVSKLRHSLSFRSSS